ncbi:hypothetical protein evm_014701 [Chilo suppressalis]|nr:hypothetical protein evm_014701 [Chilo suppressalis]
MGKKRQRDKSAERIQKKIRKLECKLNKYRRVIVYSSEDEPNSPRQTTACDPLSEEMYAMQQSHSPLPEAQLILSPTPPIITPVIMSPAPSLPSPSNAAAAGTSKTPDIAEAHLDEEILQLLGEAPEPETLLGAPVHKDIAARWHDVIKKGLSKDCKEKIFKEYLIPSNCELLIPPLLNPEAKAALTSTFIKRDLSLISRQKHLSVAIAALTCTLDKIITTKDSQRQDVLKSISDACRILCDMYHYETETRKKFVVSSINTGLQGALTNAITDKFLFGENMSERLKTAKTVQKSGEELKTVQRTQNPKYSFNKNYNTLHQKRPVAGRVPAGPRQHWSYQRGRTNSRTMHAQVPPQPPPTRPTPLPAPPLPPPPRRAGRR